MRSRSRRMPSMASPVLGAQEERCAPRGGRQHAGKTETAPGGGIPGDRGRGGSGSPGEEAGGRGAGPLPRCSHTSSPCCYFFRARQADPDRDPLLFPVSAPSGRLLGLATSSHKTQTKAPGRDRGRFWAERGSSHRRPWKKELATSSEPPEAVPSSKLIRH